MGWCYILGGLFGGMMTLYSLLDVHYFFRMCLSVLLARYFKKKLHVLDSAEFRGICLTNDIDALLYHMNNARYLREIDFARADFYERTNLYKSILAKGGSVVQGASTIRYRRFIKPFSRFYITSKVIYWDDQSIYMEHRFVSTSDGFIHCIALCKQRVTNCSVEEIMSGILTQSMIKNSLSSGKIAECECGYEANKLKPELPIEVAKWIECNTISSANLRNGC